MEIKKIYLSLEETKSYTPPEDLPITPTYKAIVEEDGKLIEAVWYAIMEIEHGKVVIEPILMIETEEGTEYYLINDLAEQGVEVFFDPDLTQFIYDYY